MKKNFVQTLFDFSFDSLITPRIISVIYGVAMFFTGIGTLIFVWNALEENFLMGIGSLILAPIVFFLGLVLARIYCELVIALFKVAENTSHLKQEKDGTRTSPVNS